MDEVADKHGGCEGGGVAGTRLALVMLLAAVLAIGVSYIYHLEASLLLAGAGMLLLWVVKYGSARWLGFSAWGSAGIVAVSAAVSAMHFITSQPPTVLIVGGDLGVPDTLMRVLAGLYAPWVEIATIPVFLLLVLGLGWKWGWLSVMLLWMYAVVIPDPISVVLANAFSDAPPDVRTWVHSAAAYMPWRHIPELIGLLAIGLAGSASGKWYRRRYGLIAEANPAHGSRM